MLVVIEGFGFGLLDPHVAVAIAPPTIKRAIPAPTKFQLTTFVVTRPVVVREKLPVVNPLAF